jgi:DNA invertase Pin-like site-specific DNA recombinase
VRVSGAAAADGDGPTRQRTAITRYARSAGVSVIEEFADLGVSGTTELDNRPGLAALLDRVESNGVRTVIVATADRLARDLMVQEVIVGKFRAVGVTVLTADGVDLTTGDGDATRTLIRQILGAVAQFEKTMLVQKLRAARERKRGTGRKKVRVEGQRPFGYYAQEAAVIARMQLLRRKPANGKRASFGAIAELVNAEGHRNRAGRPWTDDSVRHVLINGVPDDAPHRQQGNG